MTSELSQSCSTSQNEPQTADAAAASAAVAFRPLQVLSRPGAKIKAAYIVQHGIVALLSGSDDGDGLVTGLVGPGGVVNGEIVLGARQSAARAVVIAGGAGHRIPLDRASSLIQADRSVRSLMFEHAAALLVQAQNNAVCHSQHSIEARLSRFLLHASDNCEGTPLLVTQEFLARMLGVQRTSLSAVAHTLERRNLIRTLRGKVEILNPAGLREVACRCYDRFRV